MFLTIQYIERIIKGTRKKRAARYYRARERTLQHAKRMRTALPYCRAKPKMPLCRSRSRYEKAGTAVKHSRKTYSDEGRIKLCYTEKSEFTPRTDKPKGLVRAGLLFLPCR